MNESKNKIISDLNEKIEFFKGEHSILKVRSVLENNPTKKFNIEQDKKEALKQIENAEKLLENILRTSEKSSSSSAKIKQTPVFVDDNELKEKRNILHIISNTKHKDNNTSHYWYQKPIGIIGITVFSGVLIAIVLYLLKHIGIPLND